ncbi:MAG: CapA family protein [Erysipelotrichaceae bacterium]|nr:CapA family protein [Erysipelotrichaceae bacterium]
MKRVIVMICLFLLSGCVIKEPVKKTAALSAFDYSRLEFEIVESADVFMVGDALLHGAVYKQAEKNGVYDFSGMVEVLENIVDDYDLAFYNQETILGGTELGLSTYPQFNSPQEFGDAMMNLGFNLVSLANNHTMDRGQSALAASHQYWSEQDALTAGSYASFEERNTIQVREINGITYTLLAYTYGTNGIPVPQGKEYLCNVYTEEMLKEDISAARDLVDVLIVSMHWGTEYTHTPNETQEGLAHLLADLGVDLVIGHHPHVIQPVQWIDDTLVYYSLGNLISAQDGTPRLIGMMGAVTIEKRITREGREVILKDAKGDLIYTSYGWAYSNLHLKTFDQLPDMQDTYEEYCEIITRYDDSIQVGGIIKE